MLIDCYLWVDLQILKAHPNLDVALWMTLRENNAFKNVFNFLHVTSYGIDSSLNSVNSSILNNKIINC